MTGRDCHTTATCYFCWSDGTSFPNTNKKILVTGAGGFIGPHVARELLNCGNHVRAVDIKWDDYVEDTYCSEKLTLDLRIARFHNIYGPEGTYDGGREKSPAALCRKIAQVQSPGEIEIWGDGKQTRSYCYIDDCVRGVIMLMESDCETPLNIGSDRLVTINDLADIITKISGKKITKKYNLNAPQGVRGRNADLSLVKKVLNWQPQITLETGLEKTYRWIKTMVRIHTT